MSHPYRALATAGAAPPARTPWWLRLWRWLRPLPPPCAHPYERRALDAEGIWVECDSCGARLRGVRFDDLQAQFDRLGACLAAMHDAWAPVFEQRTRNNGGDDDTGR